MLNRTLRESFCEELASGFPGLPERLNCATAMAEKYNGGILRMQFSSPGVNQKCPESNRSKKSNDKGLVCRTDGFQEGQRASVILQSESVMTGFEQDKNYVKTHIKSAARRQCCSTCLKETTTAKESKQYYED